MRLPRFPGLGNLPLAVAALASVLPAQERLPDPAPRGCATLAVAMRQRDAALAGGSGAARVAGTLAASLAGRTLLTPHFAIHYTAARNVHRARLDAAQDATLKAQIDSVYATIPAGTTGYKRDSTLNARLDLAGAAHPLYVTRAAQYFERAWEHYDSLGMRMPDYPSTSGAYLLPSQGRYVVDIADVNVVSGYNDAYYAFANEPHRGGNVLLENDFLYQAFYNSNSDAITGSPIVANIGGATRNYNQEWDMGLHVTASHEFYHSVQYMYTDTLDNVHAWYELSATGMEEQLAPEVNDYLQYLPYNIPNATAASGSILVSGTFANYGNAVFHMFLTRKLGAAFDQTVWETLRNNGNVLSAALYAGAGSQARWDSLFSAYAAAMALSGSPAAASSPLAFSPDMPLWPRPRIDTVPLTGENTLTMPVGTFRIVRAPATDTGLAKLPDLHGAWHVDSSGAGYAAAFSPPGDVRFHHQGAGTAASLAVANGSFAASRQLKLSWRGQIITASPNPAPRASVSIQFASSQAGVMDTLRVVSESGREVAVLPAGGGSAWSWNLRDPQNRVVPPGVYLYRIGDRAPRALLVTP